MDLERKSLRIGALVILSAVVLRLISTGFFQPLVDAFRQPQAAAFMLYLETGRVVRYGGQEDPAWAAESPAPDLEQSQTQPRIQTVFSAEDLDLVDIRYTTTYRPDLEELLLEPLRWDLTGQEPTVLILHTHGTESYTQAPGQRYEESSAYRTLDEDYNMLRVGALLAQKLEAGGITVLHDREIHDYPSYNGSYTHAREAILAYLEEYPSIQLILDIHRDAADDGSGQMATAASVDGRESAQLMLVMGTGEDGLHYPDWQENLSLALKLHARLETVSPGICRPLSLRGQRYNQDLHPNMVLVEVGAAGDTLDKALTAVEPLAQAILSLAEGTD